MMILRKMTMMKRENAFRKCNNFLWKWQFIPNMANKTTDIVISGTKYNTDLM
jgi:hypothetical protein